MCILDPKRSKLTSRAYEFIFIGYAINSKTYRLYALKNHVIIEFNDVDFLKDKFLSKLRNSRGGFVSTSLNVSSNTEHVDSIIEHRKSKKARTTKDFGLEEDLSTF